MSDMRLFAQIRKVDEAKRLVFARAVQEVPDRSEEIFDYRTSKPYFEEWSKSQFDASAGKSYGNVRAMHGKIAAGIIAEPLSFVDAEKAIDVAIKVTDDQEWSKCNDGTYTGVSIGGSYVGERITEKVDGKDLKRYTAKPAEISLVDSPCIPTARFFEVVKADGASEQREFKSVESGGDAGTTGAAAPPIQGTPEEVDNLCRAMAAAGLAVADIISYVDVIKRAKEGTTESKDEFTVALEAAAKIGALHKRLAEDLPLVELMKIAGEHLTEDERKDLKTPEAVKAAVLGKAKMTAGQMDKMQAIHDHASSMGAKCDDGDGDKAAPTGDLAKAQETEQKLSDALARIKKLEDQPVPHVMLRAITKEVRSETPAKPNEPITLDKSDCIYNADGSIDYPSSFAQKRMKLASA